MRYPVFVAAVVISVVAAHEAGAAVTLLDDFNDNEINTDLWDAYANTPRVTVGETNQRIEIHFAADASGAVFRGSCDSLLEVEGDFDLQVDYHLIDWPYSNGVRAGLAMTQSGFCVERASLGNPSVDLPGRPREAYFVDASSDGLYCVGTADESGRLRLARVGDQVTGYYFESSEWVPIATVPRTTERTSFSFAAWSHDPLFSDQPVTVAFDNIRVSGLVAPPVADIEPSYTQILLGEEVTFDASSSYTVNPARDIVSYLWDFNDGTPATNTELAPHIFDTLGEYEISLTVWDDGDPALSDTAYHTVQVVAELIPGDLNRDGFVNSADLDIVRGHWNDTVPPGELAMGDATGDGYVGSGDLDVVRGNWGAGNVAAVPEPGVLFGVGLGCLGLTLRRRDG